MQLRKTQTNDQVHIFSNHDLRLLLVPLMIEQLLNCLMGTVDTMMVSNVGSAAISAVSLVDSINNLVIQVFVALAAGGTIVCSQYLGRKDPEGANRSARQVLLATFVISIGLTACFLILRAPLLRLIFGSVEADVMSNSLIYFSLTALSYPFLALYNASASFFRAEGNSRFPMTVSVISNILNIVGNAVMIFGLDMGVMGAALSTLGSRIFCAVVVLYFQRKPKQIIVINHYLKIRPDFRLIGMVLAVGIPSGIENGMFQFGKLAIQSTVSTMGTTAIAAQAMTIMLEMMNGIAAIGIGIGLMTVVGRCMGAGRVDEAKYYIKKLTIYSEIVMVIGCLLILALTRPVTILGGMEAESAAMCIQMMTVITIVKPLVWVLGFIPAYGLRAAGDVKFSMIVSTVSMWVFRVAFCIFLVRQFHMGPMAVWIGMFTDWAVRGLLFSIRYRSGKWLGHHVIREITE